jgi:hypothetical protein
LIVDNQDVTVVHLRLPHTMVRPRRQIDGQVPRMCLSTTYHVWLQIVTQIVAVGCGNRAGRPADGEAAHNLPEIVPLSLAAGRAIRP